MRLGRVVNIAGTMLYFVVVVVIFPIGLYILYDYFKNHRGKTRQDYFKNWSG